MNNRDYGDEDPHVDDDLDRLYNVIAHTYGGAIHFFNPCPVDIETAYLIMAMNVPPFGYHRPYLESA